MKEGIVVRHFKREMLSDEEKHTNKYFYEVIGQAKHTETGDILMIYRSLEDGSIYARPYEMFMDKVDKEKYPKIEQKYRLEETVLIDEPRKVIMNKGYADACPNCNKRFNSFHKYDERCYDCNQKLWWGF